MLIQTPNLSPHHHLFLLVTIILFSVSVGLFLWVHHFIYTLLLRMRAAGRTHHRGPALSRCSASPVPTLWRRGGEEGAGDYDFT